MLLTKTQLAERMNVTEKYLCPSNFEHIKKGGKLKGLDIKKMEGRGKNAVFEVELVDQNLPNEIWKPFPLAPEYLISDMGRVKHPSGGIMQGTENKGYIRTRIANLGQISNHRLVMLTFEPIPNAENFAVDHINGIRSDNRKINLRWVYQSENMEFQDQNQTEIKLILAELIQKYGYEETKNKLQALL